MRSINIILLLWALVISTLVVGPNILYGDISGAIRESFLLIILFVVFFIIALSLRIHIYNPLGYVYMNRGLRHLKRHEYDTAIRYFTIAIEKASKSFAIYHNRALALSAQSKFDAALQDYDTAIQLNPRFATSYAMRAGILAQKEELEKALHDCEMAINLDTRNIWAYLVRGNVEITQKDFDAAIKSFRQCIRINHRFIPGFFNLGVALSNKGDKNEAIEVYSQATQFCQYGMIYNNRGYTYSVIGGLEKALADCNKAIELNNKEHNFYGSRGHTYFLMGEYEKALQDFEKSAQLKPDHKFAMAGQAIVHHIEGRSEESKRLWQIIIDIDGAYQEAKALQREYDCADAFTEEAHKIVTLM
jgi:tetratricopeptide (TPR) repeat protein